jgi:hypothetical protein
MNHQVTEELYELICIVADCLEKNPPQNDLYEISVFLDQTCFSSSVGAVLKNIEKESKPYKKNTDKLIELSMKVPIKQNFQPTCEKNIDFMIMHGGQLITMFENLNTVLSLINQGYTPKTIFLTEHVYHSYPTEEQWEGVALLIKKVHNLDFTDILLPKKITQIMAYILLNKAPLNTEVKVKPFDNGIDSFKWLKRKITKIFDDRPLIGISVSTQPEQSKTDVIEVFGKTPHQIDHAYIINKEIEEYKKTYFNEPVEKYIRMYLLDLSKILRNIDNIPKDVLKPYLKPLNSDNNNNA